MHCRRNGGILDRCRFNDLDRFRRRLLIVYIALLFAAISVVFILYYGRFGQRFERRQRAASEAGFIAHFIFHHRILDYFYRFRIIGDAHRRIVFGQQKIDPAIGRHHGYYDGTGHARPVYAQNIDEKRTVRMESQAARLLRLRTGRDYLCGGVDALHRADISCCIGYGRQQSRTSYAVHDVLYVRVRYSFFRDGVFYRKNALAVEIFDRFHENRRGAYGRNRNIALHG